MSNSGVNTPDSRIYAAGGHVTARPGGVADCRETGGERSMESRHAHILGGRIWSTPRFPKDRWEIVKNLDFSMKSMDFHAKSLKNQAFSRFPSGVWEIWVSKKSDPPGCVRPYFRHAGADPGGDPTLQRSLHWKYFVGVEHSRPHSVQKRTLSLFDSKPSAPHLLPPRNAPFSPRARTVRTPAASSSPERSTVSESGTSDIVVRH